MAGQKKMKAAEAMMNQTDKKEHGFHVFDDLIRVPCCIVGPEVPQGLVIDQQARHIDLMPTSLL